MSLITFKNVKKDYWLGKVPISAIKNISLTIHPGEFIAICGPSGSGKSTILNLMGGLDTPTSGIITIDGHNIDTLSDNALSHLRNHTIGFIFQSFNLIPVLSIFENVEYPLLFRNEDKLTRQNKVQSLLEQVGLGKFLKHKPDELSGGQRQRVAIARALVTTPKIVLADEPTANLDSKTSTEILELMREMNLTSGTTFVFSTHDPDVLGYAKRIIKIKDGELEK